MTTEITDILDQIMEININRCSATTYDLGVQECARREIVKALALHYGVVYHIVPSGTQLFPVQGTRG
jgi:hypothetical protein